MSAEFNIQGFTPDAQPILGRDDQSFVEFYIMPRLSIAETKAADGQQVFKPVEMVKVIQPGEKDVTHVMATDFHRRRFHRQYQAFKAGQEQQETGTPLEMVFPTHPETVATLKAAHVFSVEQLENLTDTAMQNLPFGRDLVTKAKQYRAATAGAKDFHAMQRQIDDLTAKLAAMASRAEEPLAPVQTADTADSDAARDAAETVAARSGGGVPTGALGNIPVPRSAAERRPAR